MSDFEDRISSILNDPAQMSQIADLAKSLMGGGEGRSDDGGLFSKLGGLFGAEESGVDSALIGKVGRLLSGGERDSDKRALLEAMKPWLSEGRRQKMDKAMKLARVAKLVQLMGEMEGFGDV